MQNNTQLLDVMLNDQNQKQDIYKPGPYWQGYTARTKETICREGLENFRSNARIGKGYADIVQTDPFELVANDTLMHKIHKMIRTAPPVKKYFVNAYLEQVQRQRNQTYKYRDMYYTEILGDWFAEFSKKHSLPDALVGNPNDVVSINGYKMGTSYLASYLKIHNYSQRVDFSKITSFFEIGGGFGSFAHALMHLYPNITKYVYLDIPPILYVGTQYLKHFYPENVLDYEHTRSLEKLSFSSDDKREIMAICPWQISKLDVSIDMFWNCGSFEEMTADIVNNYASHVFPAMKKDGQVCLVANQREKSGVLQATDIVEIFEKNGFSNFENFAPDLETNDNKYYLGTKK